MSDSICSIYMMGAVKVKNATINLKPLESYLLTVSSFCFGNSIVEAFLLVFNFPGF